MTSLYGTRNESPRQDTIVCYDTDHNRFLLDIYPGTIVIPCGSNLILNGVAYTQIDNYDNTRPISEWKPSAHNPNINIFDSGAGLENLSIDLREPHGVLCVSGIVVMSPSLQIMDFACADASRTFLSATVPMLREFRLHNTNLVHLILDAGIAALDLSGQMQLAHLELDCPELINLRLPTTHFQSIKIDNSKLRHICGHTDMLRLVDNYLLERIDTIVNKKIIVSCCERLKSIWTNANSVHLSRVTCPRAELYSNEVTIYKCNIPNITAVAGSNERRHINHVEFNMQKNNWNCHLRVRSFPHINVNFIRRISGAGVAISINRVKDADNSMRRKFCSIVGNFSHVIGLRRNMYCIGSVKPLDVVRAWVVGQRKVIALNV